MCHVEYDPLLVQRLLRRGSSSASVRAAARLTVPWTGWKQHLQLQTMFMSAQAAGADSALPPTVTVEEAPSGKAGDEDGKHHSKVSVCVQLILYGQASADRLEQLLPLMCIIIVITDIIWKANEWECS